MTPATQHYQNYESEQLVTEEESFDNYEDNWSPEGNVQSDDNFKV